jgi:alkylation response protein AidB-like acyl-CoA dehydrogenase
MDFELTARQRELQELTAELGRERFLARAAEHDRDITLPEENLADLREAGLLTLTIAEELGGQGSGTKGKDPLLYLLAIEQIARYCPSTAQCFQVHAHDAHYIDQEGTRGQQEEILGQVVRKGALLNGVGSEPGRSTRGLYNLQTIADPVDGGYVLNGLKNYATLAQISDYSLVHGVIRDREPGEGYLTFIIASDSPGYQVVDDTWNPMGMRAAVSPNIKLTDCFVPDSHVLGRPGEQVKAGWQARYHLGFATQYLGATEGIMDVLREYLPRRGTTADPFTQLHVGQVHVEIESVRWLVYHAAWLWTRGNDELAGLASMAAKHRAIDAAVEVMNLAAQVAGSSAFLDDSRLARTFRDLRINTLHEHLDRTAATLGQAVLGEMFDVTARV